MIFLSSFFFETWALFFVMWYLRTIPSILYWYSWYLCFGVNLIILNGYSFSHIDPCILVETRDIKQWTKQYSSLAVIPLRMSYFVHPSIVPLFRFAFVFLPLSFLCLLWACDVSLKFFDCPIDYRCKWSLGVSKRFIHRDFVLLLIFLIFIAWKYLHMPNTILYSSWGNCTFSILWQ